MASQCRHVVQAGGNRPPQARQESRVVGMCWWNGGDGPRLTQATPRRPPRSDSDGLVTVAGLAVVDDRLGLVLRVHRPEHRALWPQGADAVDAVAVLVDAVVGGVDRPGIGHRGALVAIDRRAEAVVVEVFGGAHHHVPPAPGWRRSAGPDRQGEHDGPDAPPNITRS